MRTLGAVLESVEPGTVTITCGFAEGLTQQHGLFHGGVVASLVDVACGYAALSVMPADREVLTVEFKINFLKPAQTRTSDRRGPGRPGGANADRVRGLRVRRDTHAPPGANDRHDDGGGRDFVLVRF
jgi:hypothetical protein